MSNKLVLGIGGNQGDVKLTFEKSYELIEREVGKITIKSSLYLTSAWGIENQPDFINQVIIVETELTPYKVLECCLNIEKELGRKRVKKWGERVIDIDILFFTDKVINKQDLKVPHPFISDRNFVLFPLAEILPNYIHPVSGKSMLKLKNDSSDPLKVIKL